MTFVGYPNITVSNRSYRLEIKGTEEGRAFRSQSGFVYAMYETGKDEPLWRWSASGDGLGDCPHEAWLSDEGWSVVRLHQHFFAGLMVLSPQGECRFERLIQSYNDLEPGILEDADSLHIGSTSAGPNWQASSVTRFHTWQGRPYWSLLTWWGRRIVIDLDAGELVSDVPDDHLSLIRRLEQAWVLEALCSFEREPVAPDRREHVEEDGPDERHDWWGRVGFPAYTAAYQAGREGIREASVYLRQMENSEVVGGTCYSDIHYDHLQFRFVAKLSLLRLGIEPRWFASSRVTKPACRPRELVVPRSPDMFQVKESQAALLERVGPPEYFGRPAWVYAFLEPAGLSTVKVHWTSNDRPVVGRIERLDGGPWDVEPLLEYSLAHGSG